ncbi:putative rRNA methylase [Natranaerovirga hydrolytica]|uniref:Putative rRNA methylase n=1 Tax=Natranaerovirga hydrolytica TaxID=680378 RepID=A0A4R1MZI6_9FIRM|nr:class I SAM-dependent methyltransferase [Natranaerovirga hydrolytica]TCK97982.1 putative rRNA methylase [Natranaerovirga hydrolytica]
MFNKRLTDCVKDIIKENIGVGDVVVDATMGNGNDTHFLAQLVGKEGQVYSFDIQEEAIKSTKNKLLQTALDQQVLLIKDSHANMKAYIKEPVKAYMYNLGYLPNGDKNIITQKETTLFSIKEALDLLAPNGVISILSYYGHKGGLEEKEGLEALINNLDSKKYNGIAIETRNKRNCPILYLIYNKSV